MAFNHYARLKRLIEAEPEGWYICRINEPTSARKFSGEVRHFPFYYRLYSSGGQAIPYGKFQQIDRLANALGIDEVDLPIVDV